MGFLIAVAGKGGVGKTTISGIIIKRLIKAGKKPVLAVDADPNTCLDIVLGVEVKKTVGKIREEAKETAQKGLSAGISKQELLEIKIEESLVEEEDFDLVAMGRPEGPGCYCYANNVLKSVINKISSNYPYVVLDNEAGLENLSRRIVQHVDLLVLVADPSRQGLETLKRLYILAKEMKIEYASLAIIINRVRNGFSMESFDEIKKITNADIIIDLPFDDEIIKLSENGEDLNKLSDENSVIAKIDNFLSGLK